VTLGVNWWQDITDHCDFKLLAGTSPFMDALTANGTANIQTSVTGVAAGKRKFLDDRRDQPFDKRLRFSVRQTESAYRYRDIVVRKQDGFTHILLSTKSSENNSLNPEVRDAPCCAFHASPCPVLPALLSGSLCLPKLSGLAHNAPRRPEAVGT
jgi:hypothetical protein